MSVYFLVNISNNKITFTEFTCGGDKCFVVPPRSKRVINHIVSTAFCLLYYSTVYYYYYDYYYYYKSCFTGLIGGQAEMREVLKY